MFWPRRAIGQQRCANGWLLRKPLASRHRSFDVDLRCRFQKRVERVASATRSWYRFATSHSRCCGPRRRTSRYKRRSDRSRGIADLWWTTRASERSPSFSFLKCSRSNKGPPPSLSALSGLELCEAPCCLGTIASRIVFLRHWVAPISIGCALRWTKFRLG